LVLLGLFGIRDYHLQAHHKIVRMRTSSIIRAIILGLLVLLCVLKIFSGPCTCFPWQGGPFGFWSGSCRGTIPCPTYFDSFSDALFRIVNLLFIALAVLLMLCSII